ncbi:lytic murein transglycosylase [Cellvibrio sp. OA-2007]|uniref:lytic murein transglycosylase n=1 Tax=Cellvibrio sp. OA-2007 TaxID=529823 RepID=UPI0009FED10E|nr:lytic murein transglycosylase [Cellvibrio sp. OA-2007]
MPNLRELLPLVCCMSLLSCAQTPSSTTNPSSTAASTISTPAITAAADAPVITPAPMLTEAEFASCIQTFSADAKKAGISAPIIRASLGKASLSKRVLELDRQQPEFTTTFADYFNRRVTEQRVAQGRALWATHRALLDRVEQTYGVPAPYLLAFWGLETNFGGYFGNMKVVDSLATLACDPRRSTFFTIELMNALRILDEGDIAPEQMLGSWAGAMGNFQFMPSSYLKNAVDYDGDNKRDLWHSKADAFASAAKFLQSLGWLGDERWGREVKLPRNFPFLEAGLKNHKTLTEWSKLGVTRADNSPLPQAEMNASLLVPAGHQGPAFLVYDNFNVIMRWNRSEFYAIAVGQLADQIAGGGALLQTPPIDAPRLHRQQVMQLQAQLNQKGFDAGKPDGIFGPGTRRALSEFQHSQGLVADGFADHTVLKLLGIQSAPASN